MQKYDGQAKGRGSNGVVVAPGNYDGVHRGHQKLIQSSRVLATELGLRVRVLTFDPHPAALLAPDRAPPALTTAARRRELLLSHGADEVEVAHFDRAYADQTPTEFVQRLVAGGARAFVVGHDFRFGSRAAGDVHMLADLAARHGAPVHVQDKVLEGSDRISSTAIREALGVGDVKLAGQLLGHVHDVTGIVEDGDKRGRSLGFPTANLRCEPVTVPADGVYAVAVRRLGSRRQVLSGVANLGSRPTFGAGRSIEVHLLGFDGPLYGEALRVGFVARLRGERRFDGVDPLVAQIRVDCAAAQAALTDNAGGGLSWI